MMMFPEILEGRQAKTCQGRGEGHRSNFGVGQKAGGIKEHGKLVQAGVRGTGPTIKGTLGPHRNRKSGAVHV